MDRHSPVTCLVLALSMLALVGCAQGAVNDPPGTPAAAVSPTHTPSATPLPPTATATATSSPSPTVTPSPTPTPTATAVPLTVRGNPRLARLQPPAPQPGATCGLVDILDFPMDPPEGDDVSGGRDFGVFRGRYDKYHAGEDWWLARGRSNFGLPVYSIGHGAVTYAAPLGWGRDQGVVIVRHTFADGRSILSFYGHLDPPSVTLNAGDCVTRGQQVGKIGRPRTAPHLHFEIRSHLPAEPGPGYWPEDPTLAGWEPPSQYIWHDRIAAAPGVQWARPFVAAGSQEVGVIIGENSDGAAAEIVVILEAGQLVAVDAATGTNRWLLGEQEQFAAAHIIADGRLLIAVTRRGEVAAYALVDGAPADEPAWTADLETSGLPTLLPLPDGGVAVAVWRQLFALSENGVLRWQHDFAGRLGDWILTNNRLLLATTGADGGLWTVTAAGPVPWPETPNGRPALVGDQLWLYDEEGIYRLRPETLTAELLLALPRSYLGLGDIIGLPDGGALVAHTDLADRRLLRFDANGALIWERSYSGQLIGREQLLLLGERPYLLSQTTDNASRLTLYAIDLAGAELTHIFTGGTRSPILTETWALPLADGRLLLSIGGGSMAALEPGMATAVLSR